MTGHRLSLRRTGLTDIVGMLAVLAIVVGIFGLFSKHFLTLRTLQSVLNQVPDLMVIATGMTLVLIAGGIDLSVGSVLALSGVILGVALTDWGWPLWLAAALCVGVGAFCGLANGFVSALWSIPSFIVTLGMLEVARGTAYLVTDSQTKYIGPRIEGDRTTALWARRITCVSDRDRRGSDRSDLSDPHCLGPLHAGRWRQ